MRISTAGLPAFNTNAAENRLNNGVARKGEN